ncbi:hypothetical protein, partial [Shewanella algae]|uniref:hypothetical protein n=1 Tax=Shewanella algae TaxID=38313 RepID=UPI003003B55C
RWCCGDIENGSTRLFGQIHPVSEAQRFHPTGILNKGTRGLSREGFISLPASMTFMAAIYFSSPWCSFMSQAFIKTCCHMLSIQKL